MSVFAAGGFIAAAILLLVSISQHQDYQERYRRQAEAPPKAGEKPRAVHPGIEQIKCQHPEGCDKQDLYEQRRMANAAEIAVAVSTLALIAIVVSLVFTRQAVIAAADAADAARKSVEVSQRIGRNQLRPYVTVKPRGKPYFDRGGRFHGNIVVVNNGATLAHRVRSNYRCEVFTKTAAESRVWEYIDPVKPSRTLVPGAGYAFDISISNATPVPQIASPQEVSSVFGKQAQVRIWGWVKYRADGYKTDRITYFHYLVGYFELRDGTYGLHDEGNTAT